MPLRSVTSPGGRPRAFRLQHLRSGDAPGARHSPQRNFPTSPCGPPQSCETSRSGRIRRFRQVHPAPRALQRRDGRLHGAPVPPPEQPTLAAEERPANAVASNDLSVGSVIHPGDIKLVEWPRGVMPAGYISSSEAAVGRGLMRPMQANEPLPRVEAGPNGSRRRAVGDLIADGMRAISVRVDEVVGVAGFVLPGTRVDVLLTLDKIPRSREPITDVLLQNIQCSPPARRCSSDQDGKPVTVPVITLLVTPDQAETLTLAAVGPDPAVARNTLDTTADLRRPGAQGQWSARRGSRSGPSPGGWMVRPVAPRDDSTTWKCTRVAHDRCLSSDSAGRFVYHELGGSRERRSGSRGDGRLIGGWRASASCSAGGTGLRAARREQAGDRS